MSARVVVVVVNWNGEEFLRGCLRSALDQEVDGGVEVVVVDNGSNDGSVELVQREFPDVRLLHNEPNNYAAANNRGVETGSGDYALLLNTDAQLRPGALRAMVEALDGEDRAAAVQPLVLYPDGRVFTTGIREREDLYWVDRDQGATERRGGGVQQVFGVSGCCALFRREAWREVGGQDEAFHMYYEDVDLSLRLRAAGWHCLYVPAAEVVHEGHGSIRKAPKWKDELGERNRLLVLTRHYPDRFAAECVRSPWFQSAPPDEVRALLPRLAERRGETRGEASGRAGEELLLDLMLALRDAVRGLAGELDTRWGEHRNLPRILDERERWIAMLLQEVARLRLWRLPGRRLKPDEKAFLEKVRKRRQEDRS